jgi:ribosomal protein S18 acetylase RimI-like enzyme
MHIAEAADANFAAHATWALRTLPGARVIQDAGLVVTDSGLSSDTFNIVCRARLDAAGALRRIAATVAHFREERRGFSWWVGPADQPGTLPTLLEQSGLQHAESETAMSIEISALRTPDLSPEGLEVRRVRTTKDLGEFARTVSGTEHPDDPLVRFYEMSAGALLSDESPQHFYVGYLDHQPVATAEVTLAGDVAGLYAITTLPELRRRGFGSALTAVPLLDARVRGYRTAVLQASAAGASIYHRLGFRDFGEIHEFKPQAAAT